MSPSSAEGLTITRVSFRCRPLHDGLPTRDRTCRPEDRRVTQPLVVRFLAGACGVVLLAASPRTFRFLADLVARPGAGAISDVRVSDREPRGRGPRRRRPRPPSPIRTPSRPRDSAAAPQQEPQAAPAETTPADTQTSDRGGGRHHPGHLHRTTRRARPTASDAAAGRRSPEISPSVPDGDRRHVQVRDLRDPHGDGTVTRSTFRYADDGVYLERC